MASSSSSTKAISIIAPDEVKQKQKVSVFLAGSINMGKAPDWQKAITQKLSHLSMDIYNPRRGPNFDWNDGDPKILKQQVKWEHEHLKDSSIIAMFLSEKHPAPISLLELGLFARSEKLIVCCEKNFYRLDLVEWVCKEYKISLMYELNDLANEVEKRAKVVENGTFNVEKDPEDMCPPDELQPGIFLAGSITGGEAPEWQKDITNRLSHCRIPMAKYEPRRGSELERRLEIPQKQEIGGKEETLKVVYGASFKEQIGWEYRHLSTSSIVAMYFSRDENPPKPSKSAEGPCLAPIILLELGLLAATRTRRLIVGCDWSCGNCENCQNELEHKCQKKFYRLGNIKWVCDEYKIKLVQTPDDLVKAVEKRAEEIKVGTKD